MINDNVISDDDVPDIVPKRRGRKKGVKLDLLSLRPGGTGGKDEMSKRRMDTRWKLEKGIGESSGDNSKIAIVHTPLPRPRSQMCIRIMTCWSTMN